MHNRIYDSICEIIGGTPIVRLKRIPQDHWADMLVKLESINPGGTIVEATSGNTGIGLSMVCAAKGYKAILTMPDDVNIERVALLRAYGARVILTHRSELMQGAINKAEEILREHPDYFMPQQFRNPANPQIHRETTAQEILHIVGGKLDALVVGVGTGGTATGTGEILKAKIENMRLF